MLGRIKAALIKWNREQQRAQISNELDMIYNMRRECDRREKALRRQHLELAAQEMQASIPTRSARGR